MVAGAGVEPAVTVPAGCHGVAIAEGRGWLKIDEIIHIAYCLKMPAVTSSRRLAGEIKMKYECLCGQTVVFPAYGPAARVVPRLSSQTGVAKIKYYYQ